MDLDIDELFTNLLFYLARTRIAKSNLYKIFITPEYLMSSLLAANLVINEDFVNNKQYFKKIVIPQLQTRWLNVKDNL